jgi:Flp pilus assembly CpaE family ATPase
MMVGRDEASKTEHLVINRFDKNIGSLSTQLLTRILGVTKLQTIIQDVPAFNEAVNRGCTLRLAAPRSQALSDIGALAKLLLDGDASIKPPAKRFSLVGRLIHSFV